MRRGYLDLSNLLNASNPLRISVRSPLIHPLHNISPCNQFIRR